MPSKTSPHTPGDGNGEGKKKKTTPKKTTAKKTSPQKKKIYPSQRSKGERERVKPRTPEEDSMIKQCLALTIFEESEEARAERMAREEADSIEELNEEVAAKFGIHRDK